MLIICSNYFVFHFVANNRVIPSGATVIIPIFAMGRNENVFEDANQFNPDRFLESRSNERQNPFSYIPFSAGPRNCIGQKYAMYEIKCIVSKLLRHFEFDLHQENKDTLILSTEVVLRPEKPIKFYLKRRNIWFDIQSSDSVRINSTSTILTK